MDDKERRSETFYQPDSSVSFRIVQTEEEFDALQTSWDRLCENTDSHVYQTYDWNRIWWKHFGIYGDLRIFVLYDGEVVAGIAPLFLDRYGLFGFKPYTCLRIIGSKVSKTRDGPLLGTSAYSDYLQFLIRDEYVKLFHNHLINYLKREVHFDELLLEEIPEQSSTLKILDNLSPFSDHEVRIKDESKTLYIAPDESWEHYLRSLSSNLRGEVRRDLKKVDPGKRKLFHVTRLDGREDLRSVLDRFIEMHQKQWNGRGLPGSFEEKCMRHFFIDIAEKLNENQQLRIYALIGEKEPIRGECPAVDIAVDYRNRTYGLHRAMDMSSACLKQGPGKILLFSTIRFAVKSQRSLEMGRGEERYKLRLATHINQNKTMRILLSSRHRRFYGQMAMGLHFIRERITFERVRKKIMITDNWSISDWFFYIRRLFKILVRRLSGRQGKSD